MSKLLKQMDETDEDKFLERLKVILRGVIPVDADYFIMLSDTDRKKVIHMSNVGEEEAVEWLDETAAHIHKELKRKARRKG